MKNLNKQFAKRIKTLRKLKNITQEELGGKTGVSYKYIGEIERGEVNPSLDILGKIAKGFEVSLKDLMDYSDNKKGLHKDDILHPLSKSEVETVKNALGILGKVFKADG